MSRLVFIWIRVYNQIIATNQTLEKERDIIMQYEKMSYEEYMEKAFTVMKLLLEMRQAIVTEIPYEHEFIIDKIEMLFESVNGKSVCDILNLFEYFNKQNYIIGLISNDNGIYKIQDHVLQDGEVIEYLYADEWFCTWWSNNKIFDLDEIEPIGTLARVRI